jgi:hypothetical protein
LTPGSNSVVIWGSADYPLNLNGHAVDQYIYSETSEKRGFGCLI